MTYRRFFLFVAAGWSLGAACAGEVEPGPGAGGLGGEAGSAVGGGPTTGGSASGGTGGGHPDSGGTGGTTTGEGGFGGQGPVRPEPGEVVEGSLDELTQMDCVIELDEKADGTVEQRWGIDYFGDQIERKLIWEQASEDVTVVYFDEDERPWLACWPGACDVMTASEPSNPPCGGETEGAFALAVDRHDNPPLDARMGLGSVWWFAADGAPSGARHADDTGSSSGDITGLLECFFPDGTLSAFQFSLSDFEYDGDYSWTFFPNQQLHEYSRVWDNDFMGSSGKELTTCSPAGWRESDEDYELDWRGRWSTTTYGSLGGAPGAPDSVAHTVLRYSETGYPGDQVIVDSDVVSELSESDDGLSFEVTASSASAGWTDTFSLDRGVTHPHVVHRTFDDSGRLRSEAVDVDVDGLADYDRAYSYTGGCLSGESPQLDVLPRSEPIFDPQLDSPTEECLFSPLPEDVWSHYQ